MWIGSWWVVGSGWRRSPKTGPGQSREAKPKAHGENHSGQQRSHPRKATQL